MEAFFSQFVKERKYTTETVLDKLPRVYTTGMFEGECDVVNQHVFESYGGQHGTAPR